jgi:hypothetical protein
MGQLVPLQPVQQPLLLHPAGLYKLNAVDPQLESTRFQPLNLSSEKLVSRFEKLPKLVSKFAFKCNLTHYTPARGGDGAPLQPHAGLPGGGLYKLTHRLQAPAFNP